MKTAVIIERADVSLGGAERSIFELAAGLSGAGLQVDILAAAGSMDTANVKILCKKSAKRLCLSDFSELLAKYLAENKYDIIHSILPFEFADVYQPRGGAMAQAVLRSAASYQNKALRMLGRFAVNLNRRRKALCAAERKIAESPGGPVIAALSEYVKRQFIEHYNTPEQKIVTILNGVKINHYLDAAEVDKLKRQIFEHFRLDLSAEPVFLLFTANNFRLKGLIPLLKALRVVRSKSTQRPVYLLFAGKSKTANPDGLISKLKLNDAVFYLGKLRDIYTALAVCDVAALPSYYDPCSRFILEALAAGKPVITTKYNGAAELFTHNRHGITLDEPDDIDELAKAIIYFSQTDNIRSAQNAIIADNLRNNISIDRHCRQLIQLYENIMEKK